MELIDVLSHLKSKGYPVRLSERRRKVTIGSWKTFYRFNICKNDATGHFFIEGGSTAPFISGFAAGILTSILIIGKGIDGASLSTILATLFLFLLLMIYIRYFSKKEQAIRQDLDQALFDLKIAEYKALDCSNEG